VTLFPNDAPARECLVRWGDPAQGGNFGTYRIWMTQANVEPLVESRTPSATNRWIARLCTGTPA